MQKHMSCWNEYASSKRKESETPILHGDVIRKTSSQNKVPCKSIPGQGQGVFRRDVLNWIVGDGIPVSAVNGVWFHRMMLNANPNLHIPSRQTVDRDLKQQYQQVKQNFFLLLIPG